MGARPGYRPGTQSVPSRPQPRPQSPEQRPSSAGMGAPVRRSGPPTGRARPEDRGFSPRPRQDRPESRRPERSERPPRQEFGSAHERPARPERTRSGPDRRGSTGARPFDKARSSKSPARSEQGHRALHRVHLHAGPVRQIVSSSPARARIVRSHGVRNDRAPAPAGNWFRARAACAARARTQWP